MRGLFPADVLIVCFLLGQNQFQFENLASPHLRDNDGNVLIRNRHRLPEPGGVAEPRENETANGFIVTRVFPAG